MFPDCSFNDLECEQLYREILNAGVLKSLWVRGLLSQAQFWNSDRAPWVQIMTVEGPCTKQLSKLLWPST